MKKRRIIATALLVVMLLTALPAGVPAYAAGTPSAWAVPEMNDANTSGLLTPSAARDFTNTLTRDEFCELVVGMVEKTLGYPLPVPATNPFTSDTDPISIYALKAWNYGIITGISNTLFAPNQKVERQQLCAMIIRAIRGLEKDLNRTLLSPGIATLPYKDAAQIRDYAIDPVKVAYSNVIMQGANDNFMPSNNITSQECVAVVIRCYNRIENARVTNMTTAQILDIATDRVNIGYAYGDTASGVTRDLTLPTRSSGGSTVSWSSSNNGVIGVGGSVGVVNAGKTALSVTLTATIRLGNTTRDKVFILTTSPYSGDSLLLENAQNTLDIIYLNEGDSADAVTGRIGLPITVLGLPVSWRSSNQSVVSNTGIVAVPPGNETRNAALTATINLGSQTRTKVFNLVVVNPEYSRGVTLQGVQLGITLGQVNQILGTPRRTINASATETWQLYYSVNYSNFIAVAFVGNKAVGIYSMAAGVSNQLRNRAGDVISVAQANASTGVAAVSYTDQGNSWLEYAIMIYDTSSNIGSPRTLAVDGQEQLLFELVNAFRVRNGRVTLEWAPRLGTPARAHSNNGGAGNLQQRVVNGGFDSVRYAGGNTVSGSNDAFGALDQIVGNTSGSSAMRTAILQNSVTLFGAGFAASNTGAVRTYFTYALGAVTPITGVTVRQNNIIVSAVNVGVGSGAASTISLVMSPTGFNESFSVISTDKRYVTVSNPSITNTGASIIVTGVANGSSTIVVTGNCSGRSYEIPVTVSMVYASQLTLSYTDMNMILSSSINIPYNTNVTANASHTLVMGTGSTLTISAVTNNGATVEWTRTGGNVANVNKNTGNNDGIVTSTASAGDITLRARVQTGVNTYIVHYLTVRVVATQISVNPQVINLGDITTAAVTFTNPPADANSIPVYVWSCDSFLTRPPIAAETMTAAFTGAIPGTATITFTATWASSASGFLGRVTRTINVTVRGSQYAEYITVSPDTVYLIPGQTQLITATTFPSAISQTYTFTWSSSHTDIATVKGDPGNSAIGAITAESPGTAIIIVELSQGNGPVRNAFVTVNVGDWPTITIANPGVITTDIPSVQMSCTPANLPAGYTVKWRYEGTGGYIDEATGMFYIFGDAGAGTVTADLWYSNDSGQIYTGRSDSRAIEILYSGPRTSDETD